MTTSIARALVGAVIALAFAGTMLTATATAASPTGQPAARSVADKAGPGYHQPKVGSCHRLTMRQFNRWVVPSTSVPCSERHTTRTVVVKRLRGKVDWNADDVGRPIYGSCVRKLGQAVGGNDKSRAMSSYQLSFFIPSPKERARGAKWLRCDIGLLGGRVLQPIPQSLRLGNPPLPDQFARCLNGPDRGLIVTVCAKQHTYRVTGGFRNAGKRYPGEQALARAAHRRCPGLTSSNTWRYGIPLGPWEWRLGQRTTICYSKTRN
jgi:hypothetical protein